MASFKPLGESPELRQIAPDERAAVRLIEQLDAHMASLYPPESNHLDDIDTLKGANVAFFGAYLNGELAGCGAVKILKDDGVYGELKRIFVDKRYRGKGVSRAIVSRLERHLASLGIGIARLETGVKQPAALRLYAKLGYTERAPFGSYAADPLSIFMEKRL